MGGLLTFSGLYTAYAEANRTKSYNVVGGAENNVLGAPVTGATVGRGGGFQGLQPVPNSVFATVGGGSSNTADGFAATVGGGQFNSATGVATTVAGGFTNTASVGYATVEGDQYNTAGGSGAVGAVNRMWQPAMFRRSEEAT